MNKRLLEEWETALYTVFALSVGALVLRTQRRSSKPPAMPKRASRTSLTAVYHDLIPGWADMRQRCPEAFLPIASTFGGGPSTRPCHFNTHEAWRGKAPHLQATIIHLNDAHHWTREQIADWLETLDHDLTFKTPEEVKR